MQSQGKWIVIEGIDGAGKTTAIEHISSILNQEGIEFWKSRGINVT